MGFWETIIGTAEKVWERKPRKDVANALVELRNAMADCHEAYRKFEQMVPTAEPAEVERVKTFDELMALDEIPFENPKEYWARCVRSLGDCIARIGPVLEIFSPETSRALIAYQTMEEVDFGSLEVDPFFDSDEQFEKLAVTINQEKPKISLANPELDGGFENALTKLDTFIKENFKIEEIYKAH
jgi:hypothetical protein